MKYITIILFFFVCCKSSNKEMKESTNSTDLIINYEGAIDKLIPKIVFCKNCNESRDFETYQFEMNDVFFESTNRFLSSMEYSKEKNGTIVLSAIIGQNKKIFFKKKESKLLIEEMIALSQNHKNKDVIYKQLSKYLSLINK